MLFYFYSFETLSLSHVCSQVYYEVFPFDIDAVFQTMLVDTARIRLNRFQVEKKVESWFDDFYKMRWKVLYKRKVSLEIGIMTLYFLENEFIISMLGIIDYPISSPLFHLKSDTLKYLHTSMHFSCYISVTEETKNIETISIYR